MDGIFAVDRVMQVLLAVIWLGVTIGRCSLVDAGVDSTPLGLAQQAARFQGIRAWRDSWV
jgi:hypothetical protein